MVSKRPPRDEYLHRLASAGYNYVERLNRLRAFDLLPIDRKSCFVSDVYPEFGRDVVRSRE